MSSYKEGEKRSFISCGEVIVHSRIEDKKDYGILEIFSFFPLSCPPFAYGTIARISRLHAELMCNFLSSQSHKVISAFAVLVRKSTVRYLRGYFKCFFHMKSHTRQHQLRAPFMLYQTMIYPTLNSLFPLIGHKGEHSRAAHFRSLHAQLSLRYLWLVSTNTLSRNHCLDGAVCLLKSHLFIE